MLSLHPSFIINEYAAYNCHVEVVHPAMVVISFHQVMYVIVAYVVSYGVLNNLIFLVNY
jgi:hypothetical protein